VIPPARRSSPDGRTGVGQPRWYERAFGAHYRLLYQHRDEAEARRCLAALEQLVPDYPGPVLDLGCGDGRHLALVARTGRIVYGLDLSPALLAEARGRMRDAGLPGRLVRANMESLPWSQAAFGSVLSLFTAFGYFGPLAAHATLLGEIARVLRPGGFWILDYLNCRAVRRELAAGPEPARHRSVGPLDVRERRRLAGDPPRVVKEVEVRPLPGQGMAAAMWGIPASGICYAEEVALFSLPEVDDLAADHRLRRVAAAGDYDGGPLAVDSSPRWLLVFRKGEGS
jgi:SAM-dependent methyltransferase